MEDVKCQECDELVMHSFIGVKLIRAAKMTREHAEKNFGVVVGGEVIGDGYLVEYGNGYKSWSPADVFEEAYNKTSDGMSFGLAIESMRAGQRVARKGWNGKGIFIELQIPDDNSKMTTPYIYIDTTGLQTDNKSAPKSLVPWLASQTDMLSNDWILV